MKKSMILSVMLCCSFALFAKEAQHEKLNVIFMIADDLGWMDVGFNGNKFVETPNLDKLASEGMVFTNGYASGPLCSPTRATFHTGKSPATMGINVPVTKGLKGKTPGAYPMGGDKLKTKVGQRDIRHRLLPAYTNTGIDPQEVTIADCLQSAAYVTASIGKWHMGLSHSDPKADPREYGYDINIAGGDYHGPPSWFSPYRIHSLKNGPKGEHLTERLTREAINFMEENKDKPFFLYLPYYQVHSPHGAREEYIKKFDHKQTPDSKMNSIYAAMVMHLDESVGLINDYLKKSGLDKNTLLIFSSDNGPLVYQRAGNQVVPRNTRLTFAEPLRGWKGSIYEAGTRVPYIFKLPGVIPANSISQTPIITHDLYATICEFTGVAVPEEQKVEGESLFPLLTQSKALQRTSLFWHNPKYSWSLNSDILWADRPACAIRKGKYKLIYYFERKGERTLELYDLDNDQGETKNLVSDLPEKALELETELLAWLDQTQAWKPIDNPDYDSKYDSGYLPKRD